MRNKLEVQQDVCMALISHISIHRVRYIRMGSYICISQSTVQSVSMSFLTQTLHNGDPF